MSERDYHKSLIAKARALNVLPLNDVPTLIRDLRVALEKVINERDGVQEDLPDKGVKEFLDSLQVGQLIAVKNRFGTLMSAYYIARGEDWFEIKRSPGDVVQRVLFSDATPMPIDALPRERSQNE